MDRKDVFEYVKKQYGTVPEYLWKESPESAVLRHKNGKWYAVLMQVKKSKLELEGEGTVDIINVKCEPDMVGVLIETYGFLPGYHMNKEHWITMLMDGTVSEALKEMIQQKLSDYTGSVIQADAGIYQKETEKAGGLCIPK